MDSSMVSDPRFKLVAASLDVKLTEVFGSCFLLWMACYERRSERLRKVEADASAGLSGFAEALIEETLADDDGDGYVIIHGVDERIQFLLKQAERGAKGGKVKKKQAKAKRRLSERKASASDCTSERKANTPSPSPDHSPTPAPSESRARAAAPPDGEPSSSKPKGKAKPNPDHQALVDGFHQLFLTHTGGSKPSWRPKELALVKSLLGAHGLTTCLQRARNMFEAPPPFPPPPFDLATLSTHFDKYAEPYSGNGATSGAKRIFDLSERMRLEREAAEATEAESAETGEEIVF